MGLRDDERISREIDDYATKHFYDENETHETKYPIVVVVNNKLEKKNEE